MGKYQDDDGLEAGLAELAELDEDDEELADELRELGWERDEVSGEWYKQEG